MLKDACVQTTIFVLPHFPITENEIRVRCLRTCQTVLHIDKQTPYESFVLQLKFVPYNQIKKDCLRALPLPKRHVLRFKDDENIMDKTYENSKVQTVIAVSPHILDEDMVANVFKDASMQTLISFTPTESVTNIEKGLKTLVVPEDKNSQTISPKEWIDIDSDQNPHEQQIKNVMDNTVKKLEDRLNRMVEQYGSKPGKYEAKSNTIQSTERLGDSRRNKRNEVACEYTGPQCAAVPVLQESKFCKKKETITTRSTPEVNKQCIQYKRSSLPDLLTIRLAGGRPKHKKRLGPCSKFANSFNYPGRKMWQNNQLLVNQEPDYADSYLEQLCQDNSGTQTDNVEPASCTPKAIEIPWHLITYQIQEKTEIKCTEENPILSPERIMELTVADFSAKRLNQIKKDILDDPLGNTDLPLEEIKSLVLQEGGYKNPEPKKEFNPENVIRPKYKPEQVFDPSCDRENEPYMDKMYSYFPDNCNEIGACNSRIEMPWDNILLPKNCTIRKKYTLPQKNKNNTVGKYETDCGCSKSTVSKPKLDINQTNCGCGTQLRNKSNINENKLDISCQNCGCKTIKNQKKNPNKYEQKCLNFNKEEIKNESTESKPGNKLDILKDCVSSPHESKIDFINTLGVKPENTLSPESNLLNAYRENLDKFKKNRIPCHCPCIPKDADNQISKFQNFKNNKSDRIATILESCKKEMEPIKDGINQLRDKIRDLNIQDFPIYSDESQSSRIQNYQPCYMTSYASMGGAELSFTYSQAMPSTYSYPCMTCCNPFEIPQMPPSPGIAAPNQLFLKGNHRSRSKNKDSSKWGSSSASSEELPFSEDSNISMEQKNKALPIHQIDKSKFDNRHFLKDITDSDSSDFGICRKCPARFNSKSARKKIPDKTIPNKNSFNHEGTMFPERKIRGTKGKINKSKKKNKACYVAIECKIAQSEENASDENSECEEIVTTKSESSPKAVKEKGDIAKKIKPQCCSKCVGNNLLEQSKEIDNKNVELDKAVDSSEVEYKLTRKSDEATTNKDNTSDGFNEKCSQTNTLTTATTKRDEGITCVLKTLFEEDNNTLKDTKDNFIAQNDSKSVSTQSTNSKTSNRNVDNKSTQSNSNSKNAPETHAIVKRDIETSCCLKSGYEIQCSPIMNQEDPKNYFERQKQQSVSIQSINNTENRCGSECTNPKYCPKYYQYYTSQNENVNNLDNLKIKTDTPTEKCVKDACTCTSASQTKIQSQATQCGTNDLNTKNAETLTTCTTDRSTCTVCDNIFLGKATNTMCDECVNTSNKSPFQPVANDSTSCEIMNCVYKMNRSSKNTSINEDIEKNQSLKPTEINNNTTCESNCVYKNNKTSNNETVLEEQSGKDADKQNIDNKFSNKEFFITTNQIAQPIENNVCKAKTKKRNSIKYKWRIKCPANQNECNNIDNITPNTNIEIDNSCNSKCIRINEIIKIEENPIQTTKNGTKDTLTTKNQNLKRNVKKEILDNNDKKECSNKFNGNQQQAITCDKIKQCQKQIDEKYKNIQNYLTMCHSMLENDKMQIDENAILSQNSCCQKCIDIIENIEEKYATKEEDNMDRTSCNENEIMSEEVDSKNKNEKSNLKECNINSNNEQILNKIDQDKTKKNKKESKKSDDETSQKEYHKSRTGCCKFSKNNHNDTLNKKENSNSNENSCLTNKEPCNLKCIGFTEITETQPSNLTEIENKSVEESAYTKSENDTMEGSQISICSDLCTNKNQMGKKPKWVSKIPKRCESSCINKFTEESEQSKNAKDEDTLQNSSIIKLEDIVVENKPCTNDNNCGLKKCSLNSNSKMTSNIPNSIEQPKEISQVITPQNTGIKDMNSNRRVVTSCDESNCRAYDTQLCSRYKCIENETEKNDRRLMKPENKTCNQIYKQKECPSNKQNDQLFMKGKEYAPRGCNNDCSNKSNQFLLENGSVKKEHQSSTASATTTVSTPKEILDECVPTEKKHIENNQLSASNVSSKKVSHLSNRLNSIINTNNGQINNQPIGSPTSNHQNTKNKNCNEEDIPPDDEETESFYKNPTPIKSPESSLLENSLYNEKIVLTEIISSATTHPSSKKLQETYNSNDYSTTDNTSLIDSPAIASKLSYNTEDNVTVKQTETRADPKTGAIPNFELYNKCDARCSPIAIVEPKIKPKLNNHTQQFKGKKEGCFPIKCNTKSTYSDSLKETLEESLIKSELSTNTQNTQNTGLDVIEPSTVSKLGFSTENIEIESENANIDPSTTIMVNFDVYENSESYSSSTPKLELHTDSKQNNSLQLEQNKDSSTNTKLCDNSTQTDSHDIARCSPIAIVEPKIRSILSNHTQQFKGKKEGCFSIKCNTKSTYSDSLKETLEGSLIKSEISTNTQNTGLDVIAPPTVSKLGFSTENIKIESENSNIDPSTTIMVNFDLYENSESYSSSTPKLELYTDSKENNSLPLEQNKDSSTNTKLCDNSTQTDSDDIARCSLIATVEPKIRSQLSNHAQQVRGKKGGCFSIKCNTTNTYSDSLKETLDGSLIKSVISTNTQTTQNTGLDVIVPTTVSKLGFNGENIEIELENSRNIDPSTAIMVNFDSHVKSESKSSTTPKLELQTVSKQNISLPLVQNKNSSINTKLCNNCTQTDSEDVVRCSPIPINQMVEPKITSKLNTHTEQLKIKNKICSSSKCNTNSKYPNSLKESLEEPSLKSEISSNTQNTQNLSLDMIELPTVSKLRFNSKDIEIKSENSNDIHPSTTIMVNFDLYEKSASQSSSTPQLELETDSKQNNSFEHNRDSCSKTKLYDNKKQTDSDDAKEISLPSSKEISSDYTESVNKDSNQVDHQNFIAKSKQNTTPEIDSDSKKKSKTAQNDCRSFKEFAITNTRHTDSPNVFSGSDNYGCPAKIIVEINLHNQQFTVANEFKSKLNQSEGLSSSENTNQSFANNEICSSSKQQSPEPDPFLNPVNSMYSGNKSNTSGDKTLLGSNICSKTIRSDPGSTAKNSPSMNEELEIVQFQNNYCPKKKCNVCFDMLQIDSINQSAEEYVENAYENVPNSNNWEDEEKSEVAKALNSDKCDVSKIPQINSIPNTLSHSDILDFVHQSTENCRQQPNVGNKPKIDLLSKVEDSQLRNKTGLCSCSAVKNGTNKSNLSSTEQEMNELIVHSPDNETSHSSSSKSNNKISKTNKQQFNNKRFSCLCSVAQNVHSSLSGKVEMNQSNTTQQFDEAGTEQHISNTTQQLPDPICTCTSRENIIYKDHILNDRPSVSSSLHAKSNRSNNVHPYNEPIIDNKLDRQLLSSNVRTNTNESNVSRIEDVHEEMKCFCSKKENTENNRNKDNLPNPNTKISLSSGIANISNRTYHQPQYDKPLVKKVEDRHRIKQCLCTKEENVENISYIQKSNRSYLQPPCYEPVITKKIDALIAKKCACIKKENAENISYIEKSHRSYLQPQYDEPVVTKKIDALAAKECARLKKENAENISYIEKTNRSFLQPQYDESVVTNTADELETKECSCSKKKNAENISYKENSPNSNDTSGIISSGIINTSSRSYSQPQHDEPVGNKVEDVHRVKECPCPKKENAENISCTETSNRSYLQAPYDEPVVTKKIDPLEANECACSKTENIENISYKENLPIVNDETSLSSSIKIQSQDDEPVVTAIEDTQYYDKKSLSISVRSKLNRSKITQQCDEQVPNIIKTIDVCSCPRQQTVTNANDNTSFSTSVPKLNTIHQYDEILIKMEGTQLQNKPAAHNMRVSNEIVSTIIENNKESRNADRCTCPTEKIIINSSNKAASINTTDKTSLSRSVRSKSNQSNDMHQRKKSDVSTKEVPLLDIGPESSSSGSPVSNIRDKDRNKSEKCNCPITQNQLDADNSQNVNNNPSLSNRVLSKSNRSNITQKSVEIVNIENTCLYSESDTASRPNEENIRNSLLSANNKTTLSNGIQNKSNASNTMRQHNGSVSANLEVKDLSRKSETCRCQIETNENNILHNTNMENVKDITSLSNSLPRKSNTTQKSDETVTTKIENMQLSNKSNSSLRTANENLNNELVNANNKSSLSSSVESKSNPSNTMQQEGEPISANIEEKKIGSKPEKCCCPIEQNDAKYLDKNNLENSKDITSLSNSTPSKSNRSNTTQKSVDIVTTKIENMQLNNESDPSLKLANKNLQNESVNANNKRSFSSSVESKSNPSNTIQQHGDLVSANIEDINMSSKREKCVCPIENNDTNHLDKDNLENAKERTSLSNSIPSKSNRSNASQKSNDIVTSNMDNTQLSNESDLSLRLANKNLQNESVNANNKISLSSSFESKSNPSNAIQQGKPDSANIEDKKISSKSEKCCCPIEQKETSHLDKANLENIKDITSLSNSIPSKSNRSNTTQKSVEIVTTNIKTTQLSNESDPTLRLSNNNVENESVHANKKRSLSSSIESKYNPSNTIKQQGEPVSDNLEDKKVSSKSEKCCCPIEQNETNHLDKGNLENAKDILSLSNSVRSKSNRSYTTEKSVEIRNTLLSNEPDPALRMPNENLENELVNVTNRISLPSSVESKSKTMQQPVEPVSANIEDAKMSSNSEKCSCPIEQNETKQLDKVNLENARDISSLSNSDPSKSNRSNTTGKSVEILTTKIENTQLSNAPDSALKLAKESLKNELVNAKNKTSLSSSVESKSYPSNTMQQEGEPVSTNIEYKKISSKPEICCCPIEQNETNHLDKGKLENAKDILSLSNSVRSKSNRSNTTEKSIEIKNTQLSNEPDPALRMPNENLENELVNVTNRTSLPSSVESKSNTMQQQVEPVSANIEDTKMSSNPEKCPCPIEQNESKQLDKVNLENARDISSLSNSVPSKSNRSNTTEKSGEIRNTQLSNAPDSSLRMPNENLENELVNVTNRRSLPSSVGSKSNTMQQQGESVSDSIEDNKMSSNSEKCPCPIEQNETKQLDKVNLENAKDISSLSNSVPSKSNRSNTTEKSGEIRNTQLSNAPDSSLRMPNENLENELVNVTNRRSLPSSIGSKSNTIQQQGEPVSDSIEDNKMSSNSEKCPCPIEQNETKQLDKVNLENARDISSLSNSVPSKSNRSNTTEKSIEIKNTQLSNAPDSSLRMPNENLENELVNVTNRTSLPSSVESKANTLQQQGEPVSANIEDQKMSRNPEKCSCPIEQNETKQLDKINLENARDISSLSNSDPSKSNRSNTTEKSIEILTTRIENTQLSNEPNSSLKLAKESLGNINDNLENVKDISLLSNSVTSKSNRSYTTQKSVETTKIENSKDNLGNLKYNTSLSNSMKKSQIYVEADDSLSRTKENERNDEPASTEIKEKLKGKQDVCCCPTDLKVENTSLSSSVRSKSYPSNTMQQSNDENYANELGNKNSLIKSDKSSDKISFLSNQKSITSESNPMDILANEMPMCNLDDTAHSNCMTKKCNISDMMNISKDSEMENNLQNVINSSTEGFEKDLSINRIKQDELPTNEQVNSVHSKILTELQNKSNTCCCPAENIFKNKKSSENLPVSDGSLKVPEELNDKALIGTSIQSKPSQPKATETQSFKISCEPEECSVSKCNTVNLGQDDYTQESIPPNALPSNETDPNKDVESLDNLPAEILADVSDKSNLSILIDSSSHFTAQTIKDEILNPQIKDSTSNNKPCHCPISHNSNTVVGDTPMVSIQQTPLNESPGTLNEETSSRKAQLSVNNEENLISDTPNQNENSQNIEVFGSISSSANGTIDSSSRKSSLRKSNASNGTGSTSVKNVIIKCRSDNCSSNKCNSEIIIPLESNEQPEEPLPKNLSTKSSNISSLPIPIKNKSKQSNLGSSTNSKTKYEENKLKRKTSRGSFEKDSSSKKISLVSSSSKSKTSSSKIPRPPKKSIDSGKSNHRTSLRGNIDIKIKDDVSENDNPNSICKQLNCKVKDYNLKITENVENETVKETSQSTLLPVKLDVNENVIQDNIPPINNYRTSLIGSIDIKVKDLPQNENTKSICQQEHCKVESNNLKVIADNLGNDITKEKFQPTLLPVKIENDIQEDIPPINKGSVINSISNECNTSTCSKSGNDKKLINTKFIAAENLSTDMPKHDDEASKQYTTQIRADFLGNENTKKGGNTEMYMEIVSQNSSDGIKLIEEVYEKIYNDKKNKSNNSIAKHNNPNGSQVPNGSANNNEKNGNSGLDTIEEKIEGTFEIVQEINFTINLNDNDKNVEKK